MDFSHPSKFYFSSLTVSRRHLRVQNARYEVVHKINSRHWSSYIYLSNRIASSGVFGLIIPSLSC